MVHQPTDRELKELEKAAVGTPSALSAFDAYLEALSILEEAYDEEGLANIRDFEAAVSMARCELDVQLGKSLLM